MIKRKLKECVSCKKQSYIFGHKMCSSCYRSKQKPLSSPKRQIAKFSKNKLNELKKYRKVRDAFMKENPNCERCGGVATDLHHKITRQYHLNDVGVFCSLCRECHNWVHTNDAEARKQGFLLSRLENNDRNTTEK